MPSKFSIPSLISLPSIDFHSVVITLSRHVPYRQILKIQNAGPSRIRVRRLTQDLHTRSTNYSFASYENRSYSRKSILDQIPCRISGSRIAHFKSFAGSKATLPRAEDPDFQKSRISHRTMSFPSWRHSSRLAQDSQRQPNHRW